MSMYIQCSGSDNVNVYTMYDFLYCVLFYIVCLLTM